MLNIFRSQRIPAVLSICLLAVIILVSGCDHDEEQVQDTEQLSSYKIQGPVQVSYDVYISDTQSFGTGSTPVEAKEILLFDKYVVVRSINGSGRLLPVDKIKFLNWN